MTAHETQGLSPQKLRDFASAAPPCISIVLVEAEARDARVAMKQALGEIRAKLADSAPKHEIASLLEPLEAAAASAIDSSKEPATFIFLRSPDICEIFCTRNLMGRPIAAVGEYVRLRPLLELASKHLGFYILALQLNDTRIFKCTEQRCEAARLPKKDGVEYASLPQRASESSIRAEPLSEAAEAQATAEKGGIGKILLVA